MNNTVQKNSSLPANFYKEERKLGVPVSGTFELTSHCNFNCKMCYIHSKESNNAQELTAEEWINIGKQAVAGGMSILLLTGGEPLLRADFAKIYVALKKLGLAIYINTNGSLITEEILRLFDEYPPERVSISLYGNSDETYCNLTGTQSFNVVTNSIKALKKHNISCGLNLFLNPYNAADLHKIYKFAEENGLYTKASSYQFPNVRQKSYIPGESIDRFPSEKSAFYRVACAKLRFGDAEFLRRAVHFSECGDFEDYDCNFGIYSNDCRINCHAGKSGFWIDSSGKMSACGMFNVNKFDVKEMGFNAAWQKVFQTTSQIRLPKKCNSCKDRYLCNICAGVALSETGSFEKVPPYVCRITEVTKQLITEESELILNKSCNF